MVWTEKKQKLLRGVKKIRDTKGTIHAKMGSIKDTRPTCGSCSFAPRTATLWLSLNWRR